MQVTIQTIWTLLAFLAFIGIILWAFSPRRKKSFEEAARLPLDDETAEAQITQAVENNK